MGGGTSEGSLKVETGLATRVNANKLQITTKLTSLKLIYVYSSSLSSYSILNAMSPAAQPFYTIDNGKIGLLGYDFETYKKVVVDGEFSLENGIITITNTNNGYFFYCDEYNYILVGE